MAGPEPSSRIQVAIIGAGIAGVLTYIKLLGNPHLEPKIYEASSHFSQYGVGLSLDYNGISALRLLSLACYEALKQHSSIAARKQFSIRLVEATGPRAGRFFYDVPSSAESGTVHRAHFLAALTALLPPGVVQFNKKLDHIFAIPREDAGNKTLVAHFTDSTTVRADLILGADGASSAARVHLLGNDHPETAEPTYSGEADYRILLPMSAAEEAIGKEHAHSKSIECGPGGFFVHFPIEQGRSMNMGLITYAYKEWKGPWRREASMGELREAFKGWGGNVEAVIRALDKLQHDDKTGGKDRDTLDYDNKKSPLSVWGIPHYPYSSTYTSTNDSENLALIGDAAHASTPNQGQGASQAIEDALIMGSLLSLVQRREQIRPAIEAYNIVRRERTQKVISTSAEAGHLYSFLDEEAGSDVEKVTAKVAGRWHWMWDIDLEAEVEGAVETFISNCRQRGVY
ncbi:hypothetical protein MMC10_007157 [Thelotrema lepadinum]|nr:hypothetical protein [Thelotrema lepadinum]